MGDHTVPGLTELTGKNWRTLNKAGDNSTYFALHFR